jgi:transcriptional regulator with XRE-family HTH domain
LERGARMPRVDTLVKIAAAVGVRIDCALLSGIAWNSGSIRSEAGAFTFKDQTERRWETLERAAAFRAQQSETVDAVQLVREGREELDRRTERWKEDEGK